MDQQRNILFGKLAIGRRLLTREQASEGFRAISSALRAGGGQRNLWDFCRDKGYLRDEQIALVMRVIDNGMWVCTKGCEGGTALMDFPADRPFVCPGCSAPLQIVPRTPSKSSAGSQSSHDWNSGRKSRLYTWPLTAVTRNRHARPRKRPGNSCTGVAPLDRVWTSTPPQRWVAIASASEGFSATMRTVGSAIVPRRHFTAVRSTAL